MPAADKNHATAGTALTRAVACWARARWCLGWVLLGLTVVLAAIVALNIIAGLPPAWPRAEQMGERLLWPVLMACEVAVLAHIATSVGLHRAQRHHTPQPTV